MCFFRISITARLRERGRGRRSRWAIVAGECVSLLCERGNIDGKNDRASFCSCFFCAFHSSRINFLCFFLTTHLTTGRRSFPLARMPLGSFYFTVLTSLVRVVLTRTSAPHVHKQRRYIPSRITSLDAYSLFLSLFLFLLSLCVIAVRVAILFAFA